MLNNRPDCFVWNFEIVCTFISDNVLIPNIYSVSLGMEPAITDADDIDIGFKKLKYFTSNYLQNAIFLNINSTLVEPLSKLETNLVLFPDEPYDYLVAGIFYRKFTAITKKYVDISFLTIDSSVGDHIQYTLTQDCIYDEEFKCGTWWDEDNVNTGIDTDIGWGELDLKETPRFSHIVVKGGKSEK